MTDSREPRLMFWGGVGIECSARKHVVCCYSPVPFLSVSQVEEERPRSSENDRSQDGYN